MTASVNAVISLLLLFQNPAQNSALQASAEAQRREAALRSVAEGAGRESRTVPEAVCKTNASAQERQFVERFNSLILALVDFAGDYKAGQSINVKKAKAVREAWLRLEKAEALFQEEKKK